MTGFHYSREAGAEGQILTGEGEAPGLALDLLCQREQPPLKVALAIGSALADILCIAAEDRMIHGDIRPEHVRVDTRGTVSIVGYGVPRRATRAPEQRTDEHSVDVYGLGVVLHSILSADPLGDLPKEPDAHDDAVVTRVLDMDFSEVQGRRWLEEVQRFLCQILAWSPQDRPAPLDAANVLASVAAQCPGENIEVWATRVHTAAPAQPAAPPPRPVEDLENLGGPVAIASPIAKGAVRQAPAAKGESTAFWSREKIAAMLAEDDDAPAPRREVVALPSTRTRDTPRDTTRDNMRPPDPPRPTPPSRMPDPSRIEDPGRSVVAQRPTEEPARPPAPRPAQPPERPAPAPFANARIEASTPVDDGPPEKKSNAMLWVGVAIAVFAIGCGVVTLGGGGAWFMMGGGATAEAEKAAEEAREAAAKAEREAEEARKKAEEEAAKATADAAGGAGGGASGGGAASGTTSDTKATTTGGGSAGSTAGSSGSAGPGGGSAGTSSGTKASTSSGNGTSAGKSGSTGKTTSSSGKSGTTGKATTGGSTTTAPATPPAGAPFSVKFVTPGREGKLQCGDGQTSEFAGATTMSFTTTTTCLVRIGQGKGPAQVSKTATVTCTEDNGKVTCTGG